MPPAIIASPHLMTPSRAYCTALTSRSPRPFPSLGCGCPLGKNFSLNVFLSEYNYLADFWCFGWGEDPLEYRVIAHPGPLPAAARGCTCAGGIAPERHQHLQPQASQALDPGALG